MKWQSSLDLSILRLLLKLTSVEIKFNQRTMTKRIRISSSSFRFLPEMIPGNLVNVEIDEGKPHERRVHVRLQSPIRGIRVRSHDRNEGSGDSGGRISASVSGFAGECVEGEAGRRIIGVRLLLVIARTKKTPI